MEADLDEISEEEEVAEAALMIDLPEEILEAEVDQVFAITAIKKAISQGNVLNVLRELT